MVLLHNFWFIQIIGAIGLVFIFLAWSANTRQNILRLQATNLLFFITHYFLLGAYAGMGMCIVVLMRNLLLLQKKQGNWANRPEWFYFFVMLSITTLSFTWKGWISFFPFAGIIVSMYAMWREKPAEIRYYMLISCALWIPYTIAVHSYSGLLSQLVGITGMLVGMYRHDRRPSK